MTTHFMGDNITSSVGPHFMILFCAKFMVKQEEEDEEEDIFTHTQMSSQCFCGGFVNKAICAKRAH